MSSKTIKSVDNPDGTTNFDKLDSLLRLIQKHLDYIQHRLNAPKNTNGSSRYCTNDSSGGTLDSKTSSQIDSLLKRFNGEPGSTKSDNINKKLLKLYDKLPPGDPRGEQILNQITAGRIKPKGIGKSKLKLPGEIRLNTDRGDLTNERTFSDFQILTEDHILYEQEAATAVEPAPTNAVQANNGNITPEQEQKGK